MTRGGILNPDTTQSVCGRKSDCSACHSPAMNSPDCLEGTETVQGAHCAGPCLPGAKQGLSLELPTRGGHGCICLVLVWWVLCWPGDLTWAHSVGKVPCQSHPFLSSPTSSRSRIVPSLRSWLRWLPLPPAKEQIGRVT